MPNRPQFRVNVFFMCTGKPKSSCDSLYGENCFTAVVWDRTHDKHLQGVPVIPSPSAEDLCPTSNSLAESQSFFPPHFLLFIQTLHDLDKAHSQGRASCFTDSNANLTWRHPHRHPTKIQSDIWVPHVPIKLTHKIGHTRKQCYIFSFAFTFHSFFCRGAWRRGRSMSRT